MKISILAILFFLRVSSINLYCQSASDNQDKFSRLLLTNTIGCQPSFRIDPSHFNNRLDVNFQFIFLNCGYNYQFNDCNKGFIGIGLCSLIQFQYGYCFDYHKRLIRVRSDIPLIQNLYKTDNKFVKSIRNICLGAYYEQAVFENNKEPTIGLTISLNIGTIIAEMCHRLNK